MRRTGLLVALLLLAPRLWAAEAPPALVRALFEAVHDAGFALKPLAADAAVKGADGQVRWDLATPRVPLGPGAVDHGIRLSLHPDAAAADADWQARLGNYDAARPPQPVAVGDGAKGLLGLTMSGRPLALLRVDTTVASLLWVKINPGEFSAEWDRRAAQEDQEALRKQLPALAAALLSAYDQALRDAVRAVLTYYARQRPVALLVPGECGAATAYACPPWYAPPTKLDPELEPELRLVLEAAVNRGPALAAILTGCLSDPDMGLQVYYLLMAGERNTNRFVYENLARQLPKDHKLLRYALGRYRYCRQQRQADLDQLVADGQFCAAVFFATVDATMSICGAPVVQASGAVLGFAQLWQKTLERDPKLREGLTDDAQKLVIGAFIMSHPELHVATTAPFAYTDAIVGRWKAPWTKPPAMLLSDDLRAKLEQTKTEAEWIDTLDEEYRQAGLGFVGYTAVLAAFDDIFRQRSWNHEDRLPLEPASSVRWLHEQARREVARRMDQARESAPVVAWFAGWRATAPPATP